MTQVISTQDIDKTADQIRTAVGDRVLIEPLATPKGGSRGLKIEDPDG